MTIIRGRRKIENNESGVQEERLMKLTNKERREIKSSVSIEQGVRRKHQHHQLMILVTILLDALYFYKRYPLIYFWGHTILK
ncbi:hypothetical protein HU200_066617 [Digitaria exilis]|uniref:Uncharacterized protein n=1 Tax=Digitaria exilis TaxID=1010633 RepID=A0A834ZWE0_9POAL|nr:hypothetical protein HU200_066617 [Digitaria exilis]